MAAAVTVETAAAWVRWRHHERCRSGSQADVFNYHLLPVTATSISGIWGPVRPANILKRRGLRVWL
eukprot:3230013-Pleurochrysis_carterae.AAC.1